MRALRAPLHAQAFWGIFRPNWGGGAQLAPFRPVDQPGCPTDLFGFPPRRAPPYKASLHAVTFTSLCSRVEILAASMHAMICRP
jgi:hypothetical protein